RQRLRSRTLWVLAIIWFCIIGVVTGAMWFILSLSSSTYGEGFDAYPLFSIIVYFVLLFGTLVAPAISAGSISSERSGGTLATTQVTLVGTWSILLGKAVAAWVTGLAFLVVAAPFVILSLALARTAPLQLLTAILALALQIGIFTAFGVGLSAMISSPLFAIVTAYLLVALLSIGTLIGFGLTVGVGTRYVEVEYQTFSDSYWNDYSACTGTEAEMLRCQQQVPVDCVTQTTTTAVTPTDRAWWILALNPYVILGDMVSMRDTAHRGPEDLFGMVSYGVRSLQKRVDAPGDYSDCPARPPYAGEPETNPQNELAGTIPVWWIGLGLQVIIAGGLLWGGYRRLNTPAARLPKGSRVA
ncbi:MAG: ABC transporter permease, partial [Actinobacteria bacterium]|nr:ABC transporter permease [Actinomycetota bacterium]